MSENNTKKQALAKMKKNKPMRFNGVVQRLLIVAVVVILINNPIIRDLVVELWDKSLDFWVISTTASSAVLTLCGVYYLSFHLNK